MINIEVVENTNKNVGQDDNNTWEEAILLVINGHGGVAWLQEIYESIPRYINLNANHLQTSNYGNYPKYYDQTRAHCTDLKDKHEIERIRKAQYKMTDKGLLRIQHKISGGSND